MCPLLQRTRPYKRTRPQLTGVTHWQWHDRFCTLRFGRCLGPVASTVAVPGGSFKQLLHAAIVASCVVHTAATTTTNPNHCPLQDLGAAWPPALSPVQTVATVVQATIAEDVLSVRAAVGR